MQKKLKLTQTRAISIRQLKQLFPNPIVRAFAVVIMGILGILTILLLFTVILAWRKSREIESYPGSSLKWVERGGQWPDTVTPRERLRQYAECAAFCEDVYKDTDSTIEPPKGWKLILYNSKNDSSKQPQVSSEFAYRVWEQIVIDQAIKKVKVIIAFRGTDDRKDWISNSRWLLRKTTRKKDQYDYVKDLMPGLLKFIKDQHKDVRDSDLIIITTGHSLGGGLAQYAAYSTTKIKEVYVFDTSPVTGFYSIDESKTNSVGLKIDRIYERGEVLSYIRSLFRFVLGLSTENPNITEVGFDFVSEIAWNSIIEQHKMSALAKNLQDAARK